MSDYYKSEIEVYQQVLESGRSKIDQEYLAAKIKSLEPFVERTEKEILMMFDNGAFNDVLKAYCRVAMANCHIDDDTISCVLGEINMLLDTVGASEIISR